MRDTNLNKLRQELLKPIDEECQIFCIFARIRKSLDFLKKEKVNIEYPILRFYCNWLLHIEIERAPEKIKNILERENTEGKIEGREDFLFLNYLYAELIKFFDEFNIPKKILEDKSNWRSVKKHIFEIIKETPLLTKRGSFYISGVSLNEETETVAWRLEPKEHGS